MNLNANITNNFKWKELLVGLTDEEIEIIPDSHLDNLIWITNFVLQPLRNLFGELIIISGYRNKRLNDKVGGVENSWHLVGMAVDVLPVEVNARIVASYVANNLPYNELILKTNAFHIASNPEINDRDDKFINFTAKTNVIINDVITANKVRNKMPDSFKWLLLLGIGLIIG